MEPLREPKIQAWSLTPKNTQMVLQTEVAKTLLLSARGPWAVPVSHSRSWTCSELQGPLGSQHCHCELLQERGYVKAILTLGSLQAMTTALKWLKGVTTTYTDKLESSMTVSGNRAGKGSPSQDTCNTRSRRLMSLAPRAGR